ncbi:MAG: hypothetical protein K2X76_05690, partial [Sphingomonas sp.]|nr:hypothetical protein [Sphingomonas sp.]
ERRRVALSLADLAVAPGDVVTIAGAPGAWRVTGWSLEAMVLTLDLTRLPAPAVAGSASAPGAPASPGRVRAESDAPTGTTLLVAAELPPLGDDLPSVPRLIVAAAGTAPGWRRASLLLSSDGDRFAPMGMTAPGAVIGSVTVPPRAAGSALVDEAGVIEVALAHDAMMLGDADAAALDAGANLALVGDELVQFGAATPLGANRWRLTRLLRGRRGTEAAAGTQRAGDAFVLLDPDTLVSLPLPLATLGGEVALIASGQGDAAPVRLTVPITGASVLPPAPVHLRLDAAGLPRWVRRSRAGWRWLDGADVPLGEERERYQLDAPASALAGPIAARRGTIEVRQCGAAGLSPPARLILG